MLRQEFKMPHRVIQDNQVSPTLPYTVNEPFNNYFFYKNGPNIGKPLVNGTIEFYLDSDHTQLVDTYSDISDPLHPVVNPNPFTLGADGSSAGSPYPSPVFYMQSILYYIVIKSQEGQVQWTIPHFQGTIFGGSDVSGGLTENLIPNGQFDWPVNFSLPSAAIPGQILNPSTNVALGWQFLQSPLTTTNIISYNNISNLSIEGNPQQEIVLTSTATSPESVKDFVATYGGANSFDSQSLTFSAQFVNKQSGTTPITIILEQNYGIGGSPSVFTTLQVFNVGAIRAKYSVLIQVPSSAGMNFGPGNYAAIHIQGVLGQFCNFGMTNCLLQLGAISDPIYIGQSDSAEKAQILGAVTDISQAGWQTDWYPWIYQGGYIYPSSNTGEIITQSTLTPPANGILLTGSPQSFPVSGTTNNIPNVRLYPSFGSTSDTGIIATSLGATVTVTTFYGVNEITPYAAGTAPVTVTKTQQQFSAGVSATLLNPNTVQLTFTNNFAPNPTPASKNFPYNFNYPINGAIGSFSTRASFPNPYVAPGNNTILPSVINPGSGSVPCVVNLQFSTTAFITDFRTNVQSFGVSGFRNYVAQYNSLEFASFTSNTRGTYGGGDDGSNFSTSPISVVFSVDGSYTELLGASQVHVVIPFLTRNTLAQNIITFIRKLANPFIYTIVFTGIPTAGEYLTVSDGTATYTPWFKVGGSGTAPIGQPNPIEIDLPATGNTTTSCATALALAINNLEFTIPATQCLYSTPFADFILQ